MKTENSCPPDIYPRFNESSGSGGFFEAFESVIGIRLAPFLSARSAMAFGLEKLCMTRRDEIFVPPFLSYCVLSALNKTAFPVLVPSSKTKAILVYHQYGFPQNTIEIEAEARRNNWIILNNCATSLFSSIDGMPIVKWGSFSVVSLAKFFNCGLAGGMWTEHPGLLSCICDKDKEDALSSEKLFDYYIENLSQQNTHLARLIINAIYGCIPIIRALPQRSMKALPDSGDRIRQEIRKRKRIYAKSLELLKDRIPTCPHDITPFAVPILGDANELEPLLKEINNKYQVAAEILHFDTAMNMLAPTYKKVLIVGCHDAWEEETVTAIFQHIKRAGA